MQTPPIDAVLEDSYHPPALAESVIGMLRALGGDDAAESIAPERIYTDMRSPTSDTTARVR